MDEDMQVAHLIREYDVLMQMHLSEMVSVFGVSEPAQVIKVRSGNDKTIKQIESGMLDEADLLKLVTSNDFDIALAVAESEYATAPI